LLTVVVCQPSLPLLLLVLLGLWQQLRSLAAAAAAAASTWGRTWGSSGAEQVGCVSPLNLLLTPFCLVISAF